MPAESSGAIARARASSHGACSSLLDRSLLVAPLLLARLAVTVPVHLGTRTVLEKVLRLCTRSHLRTTCPSVTAKFRTCRLRKRFD